MRQPLGRAGFTIAAAAIAVATMLVAGAGAASASGWVCTTEQYSWFGQAALGAGESFGTGVDVPVAQGTELHVNAVDYSTIDVNVGAVAVRIGDTAVTGGSTVSGGEIGATNSSEELVLVTSVALSVDRCSQVDQAGPITTDPLVVTSPAGPQAAIALVASAPAASASVVRASAPVETPSQGLPETGASSLGLILVAFGCTFVGVNLVGLSNLGRVTARGRAR